MLDSSDSSDSSTDDLFALHARDALSFGMTSIKGQHVALLVSQSAGLRIPGDDYHVPIPQIETLISARLSVALLAYL